MTSSSARKPSAPTVAKALVRAAGISLRPRYRTISPDELDALIRSGEPPTIVDVRQAADFEDGHIAGALNLPFDEFDVHRRDVPRGGPIVTVCYLGMLSRTAAQHLVADGHEMVLNLDRGMKGWRELTEDRRSEG